jgi:hypothetical protein
MSTLAQLAAELKPWFPQLDPLAAQTLVQRAYSDIRRSREWSFLKGVGVWFAPSPITTGTVTTTFLSSTVVFDAIAAPLLNAVAITQPPEGPLTVRQFRVTGGPIYNIIGWAFNTPSAGLGTATLDRPYTEGSAAGGSYMVYQPYVPAPTLDFKRWLSWVDPLNAYRFRYRNLYRTMKEVDRKDPNRTSYSIPIWIVTHDYVILPGDSQRRPRYEAWPHPVQQIGYVIEYMTTGDVGASLTALLPQQITDQCIIARAKHYGHEVTANQPNVDVKVKAYHLQAQLRANAEYVDLLNRCQLDDNSIFDSRVVEEESGPVYNGPLDADYMQSHELFLIG